MGCCISIKQDIFSSKEYIVNLSKKKINDIIEDDIKSSSKKKFRKHSSKSEETNFEIPKKKEKNRIYFNQRTKDIVKNLRLLAINEVKNIRKFFDFK